MIRKLLFFYLVLAAQAILPMQQKIEKGPAIAISSFPVYLGSCVERDDAELLYGKELPINTIFFKLKFRKLKKYSPLYNEFKRKLSCKKELYTPYEYIKDGVEKSSINLTLFGIKYAVRCKQLRKHAFESDRTFQDCRGRWLGMFAEWPMWNEEQESADLLVQKGVIVRDGCLHGPNKSPYVEQGKKK